MLTKKFVCPSDAFDCPYWKEDGSCKMADEGKDPVWECDDAMSFWDEAEYEDDFEWFVWEDEKGNRYTVQELLEQGYHFINGKPVPPFDKIYKSKFIKSWQPGEPLRIEDFIEE